MSSAAAAAAAAAGRARSIRCARGWKRNWRPSTAAAAAIRPRTTRSAATRMPPPSSRANSTASPRRPSAWAATVPDSSRCSPASRRNAVRSTTRSSRCAANLDQITTSLERLRGGGSAVPIATISAARCCWRWRRTIAARNMPMPRAAPAPATSSTTCSATTTQSGRAAGADVGPQSGTYRTVCVRTCDGFYFPISFATVPARFPDDEKTCKACARRRRPPCSAIAIPAKT